MSARRTAPGWRKPNPFAKSRAMQLHVGVHSERGSIKKFAFDLLEIPVGDSMPKDRTLREMRTARTDLVFTLRLHPDVAQMGAEHPHLARAQTAAEALGAPVIVVPTGPRFTPTARNVDALGKIASTLRADNRRIAWEPRGVWAPDEADEIAVSRDVLLVRDLTREAAPRGSTLYTRLLPFGMGARVSQSGLEHLASQIQGAETAYVVVQSEGVKRARIALREWLGLEGD